MTARWLTPVAFERQLFDRITAARFDVPSFTTVGGKRPELKLSLVFFLARWGDPDDVICLPPEDEEASP